MPRLDISPRGRDLHLSSTAIYDGSADRYDGVPVTITGWTVTAAEMPAAVYCLLTSEPACCGGCLPSDPAICIEVLAVQSIPVDGREVTLRSVFRRLHGDPCGWRYRLDATTVVHRPTHGSPFALSRRGFVAAASLLCLPVQAVAQASSPTEVAVAQRAAAADFLAARPTIDCHSHAGRILRVRQDEGHAPFTPVGEPMRRGGLATACLAIFSDSPTHRITPEGQIKAFRDPEPGELAAYAERGFTRLHALVCYSQAQFRRCGLVRKQKGLGPRPAADPSVQRWSDSATSDHSDFLTSQ